MKSDTHNDLVLWDKVVTHQIDGHLLGRHDDHIDPLQSKTDAMVMEMPLEPVVWIVPVTDESEIFNLYYLASILICVLFHIVYLYSANLIKFAAHAIMKS